MDLSFQSHDVDDVNTSPPLIKGIILLPMSYVTQSTNPKAYSNNKSKVMIISPTTIVPSIPEKCSWPTFLNLGIDWLMIEYLLPRLEIRIVPGL